VALAEPQRILREITYPYKSITQATMGMKKEILKVLEDFSEAQINLQSESAREMLSDALVGVLSVYIIKQTNELQSQKND